MGTEQPISAAFPFKAHFVEVHGARMHYVDVGEGDPVLFLHGNPTSSYLWRNIIPHMTDHARCIAPDLVGMGQSDKPKIKYRFFEHYRYLQGFIEALELTNITLVLHDWGSGLGFYYASRHPENVKALAFMEAIIKPMAWSEMPLPFRIAFRLFRLDGIGWLMLVPLNLFVNGLVPASVVRKLSAEEKRAYRAPFPTWRSRRPVRQWPREIPFDGKPGDVHEAVKSYQRWLCETPLPKLLFYATPGAILREEAVAWCRENLSNLHTIELGEGLHYLQEDHPHAIGRKLAAWYAGL